MIDTANYKFTNQWFQMGPKYVWDEILPQFNPTRILEIGSFEGAATCYLIEKLSSDNTIELHCVDTWEGGIEHKDGGNEEINMKQVEDRFHHNIQISQNKVKNPAEIYIHKNTSDLALASLLGTGKQNYFDFIYVDGSHQAPDVLCDAILSFKLLKNFGVIGFDDYYWRENLPNGIDPIRCPKTAIDAFTNIFCRKIKIVNSTLKTYPLQLYVQKLDE